MSNSIGVRSTIWPACHTSLRCGSICREPKSNGASAEATTVEMLAMDERADIASWRTVSSLSSKERINNFPCEPPPIDKFIDVSFYLG